MRGYIFTAIITAIIALIMKPPHLVFAALLPRQNSSKQNSWKISTKLQDKQKDQMSMEELVNAGKALRAKHNSIHKYIASLHGHLIKLDSRRAYFEKTKRHLDKGLEWELRQAEYKEKEIDLIQRVMKMKKEHIYLLTKHAMEQREIVRQVEIKLKSASNEKETLEEKYRHPNLKDVLGRDAEFLGPVRQHILDKTEEYTFPQVKHTLVGVRKLRSRLDHVSTLGSLFSTILLYALLLSLFYGMYMSTSLLRNKLTMARTIFAIDMSFSTLWLFIFISNMVWNQDPFELLRVHHGVWSLVFQLLIISSLIGNVFIRCVMLTAYPKRVCIAELFGAVFLGQHYYQNVGLPILLDEAIQTGLSTYVCYFLVSCIMVLHRARTFKRDRHSNSLKWLKSILKKVLGFYEELFSSKTPLEDDLMLPYAHLLGDPVLVTNFKDPRFKVY